MQVFNNILINSTVIRYSYCSKNSSRFVLTICLFQGKEELSGGISDFRSNYYFRYYNKSGGSTLNETETQKAMEDLRHSRSGSETSSDKSLSKLCKKLSSTSGTLKMGHKAFHHLLETAVRSHHPLPDIFHCTTSPLSHLRAKQCYPAIHLRQISSESRSAVQAKLQRDRELCLNCRSKHYTLAVHTVKMSNEGIIYAPMVCLYIVESTIWLASLYLAYPSYLMTHFKP